MGIGSELNQLARDEFSKSQIVKQITAIMVNRDSDHHALISAAMNDRLDTYLGKLEELLDRIETMLAGTIARAAEHNIIHKIDEVRKFVSSLAEIEFTFDVERLRQSLIKLDSLIQTLISNYHEKENRLYSQGNIQTHFVQNVGDANFIAILDMEKILRRERKYTLSESERMNLALTDGWRTFYGGLVVRDERDLFRMIDVYNLDFRILFQALFDVQDEEFKLVYQLDYFIRLVKEGALDYHAEKTKQVARYHSTRLMKLRQRLKEHIAVNNTRTGKLDIFEESLRQVLQTSRSIRTQQFEVNGLIGRRYCLQKSNKGILLLGGNTASYRQYEPIIYRLVYDGYEVFTLDHPYHGLSADVREHMGFTSRSIYDAVRLMRQGGIVHVGLVGHSLGAIAALHALIGFDEAFEGYIINSCSSLLDTMRKMAGKERSLVNLNETLKKNRPLTEDDTTLLQEIERLYSHYEQFKINLYQSLQRTRFKLEKGSSAVGIIDAMVLLAPPFSIQGAKLAPEFLIGRAPNSLVKCLFNIYINLSAYFNLHHKKDFVPYERPGFTSKDIEIVFLKIPFSDIADFMRYLRATPNPFEIMSMIDFFATRRKVHGHADFFGYLRDRFVKRVPKLFLYGKEDEYHWLTNSGSFIKTAYDMYLGPNSPPPKELPHIAHHLEAPVIPFLEFDKRGRKARVAYVQDEIIGFFMKHLGVARVRISTVDQILS